MNAESTGRSRLPATKVREVAELMRLLADPVRLMILDALSGEEMSVQALADLLGLPHQNVSQHLGVLYRRGILSRRRVGAANLYVIEDWSAWWVVGRAAEAVDDDLRDSAST